MDTVAFISNEIGDDLIVSFAISDRLDSTEINSLTLLRTPKYECLLPEDERGVSALFEGRIDDENDLVQDVTFSKAKRVIKITTQSQSYELDLEEVGEEELLKMQITFEKMNFDGRFRYACV